MSSVSAHFQSERYIASPNPIATLLGSIPAEERSTPLTFVPCLNGIVKVSDEVFYDNNRKCRISSLVYRFRDCCAVAKLIRLDNESISTRIPVRLVSLANESHEENYHKIVVFELPQQTSDADILFFLLSAIKRRIGLDGKKALNTAVKRVFSRKRAAEKGVGCNGEQTSDQICLKTDEK